MENAMGKRVAVVGKYTAALGLFAFATSAMAIQPICPYTVRHLQPTSSAASVYVAKPATKIVVEEALGRTPEEIHSKFAANMEKGFASPQASRFVTRLSNKELQRIAYYYYASNGGKSPQLLKVFAQRLDSKSLMRIAGAFGYANVQTAIDSYAPAIVQREFRAHVAAGLVPMTAAPDSSRFTVMPMSGPAPTVDMTLEEIYLDFRTAPVGNLSVPGALSETLSFAGGRLIAAWGVGYAVGTGISQLIQTYDPPLDDAIGGTVDESIKILQNDALAINNALSADTRATAEDTADGAFGNPVLDSADPWGDWNVDQDMGDASGACN